MITLCMDTSHRYLTLALVNENEMIASFQKECFKRQSETILEELDALIKKANIDKKEIGAVCITKGPGSYTGVRIAMTIAKVLCTRFHLPLYTLSTLRLFACGKKDCTVILDARSKRVYTATYQNGICVYGERVCPLDELKLDDEVELMGDVELVQREIPAQDYAKSFLLNREYWQREENAHTVVPEYLKENSEYLVR